jgi:hypothetical protein
MAASAACAAAAAAAAHWDGMQQVSTADSAHVMILWVWVVYLIPKIERIIISLLSASPVGEALLPMPKGMAYKD